jgi:hypothetical protein
MAQANAPEKLQVIRFGEYLVERGAIDREQLLRALMEHHLRGGRLGNVVTRLGLCPRARVEALALEYHDLDAVEV